MRESRTKGVTLLIWSLLLSFALAPGLGAQVDARIDSVETYVTLRPDGRADVYYSLDWRVRGSRGMRAFYMQGIEETPVWNPEYCYVDLPEGRRVPVQVLRHDFRAPLV